MVIALAVLYMRYGLPWVQGAFYGIEAAVIARIARRAYKLTRSTLAATADYGIGKGRRVLDRGYR